MTIDCAEGSYCEAETYEGGTGCPDESGGYTTVHDWGYKLHCPAGSDAPDTCTVGALCPNATYAGTCPAGSFCDAGANDTMG